VADVVIASLLGAWATQKMIGALPGLSGLRLPIVDHANAIALVVLLCIPARFALETIVSILYPERLRAVQPEKVPWSGTTQRLLSLAFRTTLFVFAAIAYIGDCWELWVGAALFVVPQVLCIYERRFPNSESLYRVLPGGIVKTVTMMFVGQWFFLLFREHVSTANLLAYGFVFLGLPSLALSLAELFGRDGDDPRDAWWRQLGGTGVLAIGVLFVFGYFS
jgi:hypothetical protein